MQQYQREFLQFALAQGVLKFGQFELKSGRISPYFFNAGLFNDGESLSVLGRFYAQAIQDSGLTFDMLFGPAYKGIPLATTTAVAYQRDFQRSLPMAFNRKEAKAHGEGGSLVGAPLAGKVLIIDDVITAGTAIRETLDMFAAQRVQAAGVVVALDRQERGQGDLSSIQELQKERNIKVLSIVTLADLQEFLSEQDASLWSQHLPLITEYRQQYGIT